MYFGGIAFPAGRTVTLLQQCSENPEFGTTLARRLNQSRASAVLQSKLIAIKFGTAEARRLNWALLYTSPVRQNGTGNGGTLGMGGKGEGLAGGIF